MYESFYGLRERPFELTANPRFLLLTAMHQEALATLKFGVTGRKGLTVLVGEAGTGKTTIVRKALDDLEAANYRVAYINNPTLTRADFFEWLAGSFGLNGGARSSKLHLLRELMDVLSDRTRQSSAAALLIDEAQVLPDELLEEIRLLVNIETPSEKLLPVVLVGQQELADRLNQTSLRQLKQRIALRCALAPLDARDTAGYIAGRIRIAGGKSEQLFTREAVLTISERSGGIPRLINVICDNALIAGFASDRRPVTRDFVEEVCRDFDLQPSQPGAEAVTGLLSAQPLRIRRDADVHDGPAAEAASEQTVEMVPDTRRKRRFSFFRALSS